MPIKKTLRRGDNLENLLKMYFPKILSAAGFEVCTFRPSASRVGDITDFQPIEFKIRIPIATNQAGQLAKSLQEERFIWALESKAKEGVTTKAVKDTELSSKALELQQQCKTVETWIIFAPERPLNDKGDRLFRNNTNFSFHIEIWDASNLEFRKIFAILGEQVWSKFFPQQPFKPIAIEEVKEFVLRIARLGKEKWQNHEKKLTIAPSTLINNKVKVSHDKTVIKKIHRFLDRINSLLDREFPIVKKRLYLDAWKIGLAYSKYTASELHYLLFPVKEDENEVLIKKVEEFDKGSIRRIAFFTLHLQENPIENNAEKYAEEIVKNQFTKVLEERKLQHGVSSFLASEYLFAVIDRLHIQLGLEPRQSKYSIKQIDHAFNHHLQWWVELRMNHEKNSKSPLPSLMTKEIWDKQVKIDPDFLLTVNCSTELAKDLSQKIKENFANLTPPNWPLYNSKLPFRLFIEFLEFMKNQKIHHIDRSFVLKDFSRLGTRGGWIWEIFSADALRKNLDILFKEFPETFKGIVEKNNPGLSGWLKNKKIFLTFSDIKDSYDRGDQLGPSYEMVITSCLENTGSLVEVLWGERAEKFNAIEWTPRTFNFEGGNYKIERMSFGILDFIYEETPTLDFVYKMLTEVSDSFFSNI